MHYIKRIHDTKSLYIIYFENEYKNYYNIHIYKTNYISGENTMEINIFNLKSIVTISSSF